MRNTQLQEEINDLKVRNKDLLKDVQRREDREEELRKLLENERVRHREDKDEKRQMEEDLAQMREQIRSYRLQLDNTAESVAAREERNREAKKGLRQKTREINNLEEERSKLADQLAARDAELKEMVENLEDVMAELEEEKEAAAERARLVDSLENQLSKAEAAEADALAKVDGLEAELAEEEAEQEAMAKEYEATIAELKREVRLRGRTIEERDSKISELETRVEALNEGRQVVAMREALEEMQRRLDDAIADARTARGEAGEVREAEARAASRITSAEAAAAEQLAAERARSRAELDRALARIEEGKAELARQKAREAALGEKLAQREDVIVELRARMSEYEVGVFGLREAVQETERLRNTLQARDDEVARMTRERNARESQLQDLAEEVAWLRERAGIGAPGAEGGGDTGGTGDSPTGIDLTKLRLRSQVEMEKLRAANMALEAEVEELEEERLRLKKQLRVKALGRGERAAILEMTVEKLTALEEMHAGLHEDPDFEGERIGPKRMLRPAPSVATGEGSAADTSAARAAALAASDLNSLSGAALRDRAASLQAELAEISTQLAESEGKRRSAERARVSLATDKQELEARVALLAAAQTGGAAQAAAMRELIEEVSSGLRSLSHSLQAEAIARADGAPGAPASTPRGAAPGRAPPPTAAISLATQKSAEAAAAAAARAAALSSRLATRLNEIDSAPPPPPVDAATAAAAAAAGRRPAAAHRVHPAPAAAIAPATTTAVQRVEAEAQRSAARLRSLQGLGDARSQAEAVALPAEIEASDAPAELLLAALSAQLLEAMATIAMREQECEAMSREARGYSSTYKRLEEQQSILYATHVRQLKELSTQLRRAEARAGRAEAQAAEDRVRIDSWSAMGTALEMSGDEAQAAIASMGRRLTALRVRELVLSRTAAAQASELEGLRKGQQAAAEEARQAAAEAAARGARLERARRELEARLGEATRKLVGSAPREELEAERSSHEALQRAYRSAVDQAARCAGAEHEAVALRAEAALLREQLTVSQANAHSAAEAAAAAHAALQQLQQKPQPQTAAAASATPSRSSAAAARAQLELEARVAALEISQAAAISRAEAAERVLADAQRARQVLTERLQAVEAPVGEMRTALLAAEEELAASQRELAAARREASGGGGPAEGVRSLEAGSHSLEFELSVARAELDRAREMEQVAVAQATELAARLEADEAENAALRAAALQLAEASDEGVELGRMQWEVMVARRAEGEARRKEAAARAKLYHTQAALHRAHLQLDARTVAVADATARLASEQSEHSRRLSEVRTEVATHVPLSQLEAATAKINEHAARAAAAVDRANEAEREREKLYAELAAAAARDEDQRALLAKLIGEAQPSADVTSSGDNEAMVAARVSLAQLSEEKTQHKVAELRLRRQVAALETSIAREAATAREATVAREAAEEALVRVQEQARLKEREAAAREGELKTELAAVRSQLTQAQLDAVTLRRGPTAAAVDSQPASETPAAPTSQITTPAKPDAPQPRDVTLPSGDWPGGPAVDTRDGAGGMVARAVVLELQTQLTAKESELGLLRSDLAAVRAELAEARAELAAEGEVVARKEALIAELHAAHTADARAAAEGGAGAAEAALAAAAGAGARQARLSAIAQETIDGLHIKVRKQEEMSAKLRAMLEASREALRTEKAANAAEIEKLNERLYQLQASGLRELEGELRKVDEAPLPRASDGLELSGAQVEELLIEKDETIQRLQVEAEAAAHEVAALRIHLQEQVAEVERLGGALEAEKRREPSSAMHSQLAQLRALARKKDSELSRMRTAMADLREEMTLVAKENAERSARAAALSAKLEAKASEREEEGKLASRLSALQERHTKLLTEVRALKQREEISRSQAESLATQLGEAESLATRQAGELARYRSDLAAAVARCEAAETANESLAAQLSLRTDALNTLTAAPIEPPTPPGASPEMVQHAVDVAVAAERERWQATRDALTQMRAEVRDVQAAREAAMRAPGSGESMRGSCGGPISEAPASGSAVLHEHTEPDAERFKQIEGARKLAVAEADRLRSQLRQAEAQLHELKQESGTISPSAIQAGAGGNGTPSRRSDGVPAGGPAGAGSSSMAALERWEAEKRMQRRLETVRAKLQAKSSELVAAEAELARTREELADCQKREAATRSLAAEAQESAAKMARERASGMGEAMTQMRAREALSAQLAQAQAQLRRVEEADAAERSRRMEEREEERRAAAEAAAAAAVADGVAATSEDEPSVLRARLVASEERSLELSFTVEQLNLSVAQLEARVRDLLAYQSFLVASGEVSGGAIVSRSGSRGRGRGIATAPGREELNAVVERMGRVIETLQSEKAALQKRAVSNVEHVKLAKEAKVLRSQVEALQAALNEAQARTASAREEIDRAAKYQRERDEARRSLRVEEERSAELRSRLAAEKRERENAERGVSPSGDRSLEARLAELRSELLEKRSQVVELGTQLQEALASADAAQKRATVLAEDGHRMSSELAAAQNALREAEAAAAQASIGAHAEGGAAYAARLEAALAALHEEHAALQRERDSMAEELAALTPEFFDEVEDLKFNYAQAQAELERLEAARRG